MIPIHDIAPVCVVAALVLDTASQWRQIRKTLRTKQSSQISSTAFMYKIIKVFFSMTGLALYGNFVGTGMECFMLFVYMFALGVIIRFKPRNWRMF